MDPVTAVISTVILTTRVSYTGELELWMVIVGFVLSFILAVGIGANDVANSFATTVGAKVLTLLQVCILASIFETAGAVLLGSKVSDTIRKGIFDVSLYEGEEDVLMLGQIAALGGAFIWLFIATWLSLPVSGTHSIVGAMLGFHLVVKGVEGIKWTKFGLIITSWFTSPFLSGIVSAIIFSLYSRFVLNKVDPLEPGLRALPVCYGLILVVNIFSITFDGPSLLGLDSLPQWGPPVISIGISLVISLMVWFGVVPVLRRKYTRELATENTELENSCKENGRLDQEARQTEMLEVTCMTDESCNNSAGFNSLDDGNQRGCGVYRRIQSILHPPKKKGSHDWLEVQDKAVIKKLCSPLQILSASFASFAHGGNDVSNAISPVVALWLIYKSGEVSGTNTTPFWILLFGGFGISVGLWLFGRRVMETMGENLTPMTSSSGFTIELGAAMTVLTASNLGIPVSTTHCKVGSIVAIGLVRSRKHVDWSLFRNIILAWIVTLPITASLSAVLMIMLQLTV